MKIDIVSNYDEMSRKSANFVIKKILQGQKKKTFGLATGNTPTGMYKRLAESINSGLIKNKAIYLNIDEYSGVNLFSNGTCSWYLKKHFYNLIDLNTEKYIFINENNYNEYENIIHDFGGLDILVLGIGENGHIAYNEPYTSFNTETHKQLLTKESKIQHHKEFGGEENVPDMAVTIGIKTIMKAKNIILMANGTYKAEIIKKALRGKITEEIPASVLQLHPNLYVVIDREAASLL